MVPNTLQNSLRFHALGLLATMVVKAAVFIYLVLDGRAFEHLGQFAQWSSDSSEYVWPVDELLEHGTFKQDHRMPGYTPPLYLARMVLSRGAAADAVVLLQWFLACCAAWACTVMVLWLTRSSRWATLAFVLQCTAMFHARLENTLLSESFCTSALTLAVFSLMAHLRNGRKGWLFAAGLLLTWAVFLRPIYVLLFPVFGLLLLVRTAQPWRVRAGQVLLFMLPWFVIDGAWILRNYRVHGEVRPLTNGLYNPKFTASPYHALLQFVTAYGGNYNFWDPTSDLRWFGLRDLPAQGAVPQTSEDKEPPSYAYASEYNRDSLLQFRPLMERLRDTTISVVEQDSIRARVWEMAMRYRAAYVEEHPFRYHITSRVQLLGHLVLHSGSSVIFSKPWSAMAWWEKGLKLYQSAVYVAAVLFGMIGGLWLLMLHRRDTAYLILVGTVVYGVLINPFALRLCEMRYLVPIFPIILVVVVLVARTITVRAMGWWGNRRSG